MGISPCSALSQNVCIENKADNGKDGFIGGLLLMQVNKCKAGGRNNQRQEDKRAHDYSVHLFLPLDVLSKGGSL